MGMTGGLGVGGVVGEGMIVFCFCQKLSTPNMRFQNFNIDKACKFRPSG